MLAAAVSADRQTAADDLAECGQVRGNIFVVIKTRIGLCRAVVEAESGDHLIVNDE
ncbi:hypothetical protein D3C72_2137980 [compost metagenome]